jgi:hypothetical protein
MANKSIFTGVRGQSIQPASFIRDVNEKVYLVYPHEVPTWQMAFNMANKKKATQAEYELQHDTYRPFYLTVNAGGYAGSNPTSTYTDLANVSFFSVGDGIYNLMTRQNLKVTAVDPGSGAITLATWDGTNVDAGAEDDKLMYLNTPFEQGGSLPEAKSTIIDFITNYAESFYTGIAVDWSTKASKLYQGNDWVYQNQKAILEHKVKMENAFLYGFPVKSIVNGRRYYTTGGLVTSIIKTHRPTYTWNKATFFDKFTETLESEIMTTGRREKVMQCNGTFLSHLTQSAGPNIRVTAGNIGSYGLKYQKWESDFGTVSFILNRWLGYQSGKGEAVWLQPEDLLAFYLQDTTTVAINPGRRTHDEHGLYTEAGIAYGGEENAGYFSES